MAAFLSDLLGADEHLGLFAALEASANQIGLAIAIARVDVAPPRVLYVSDSMRILTGYPLEMMPTLTLPDVLSAADTARIVELIRTRTVDSPPLQLEVDLIRRDRSTIPVEVGVVRIASSLGQLAVCHLRDISARRSALIQLERSEQRFRALIEKAPDGVVILREGRIVFANKTAAELLGVADPAAALGKPIVSFLPPADAQRTMERIREMMMTGVDFPPTEYGVVGQPGRSVEIKSIPWEWEGKPAVLAFARDVSERAALQREMVRADRLASMGTLAAAVAHEINNPLTYTTLSLRQIDQRLRDRSDLTLREHVRNAREGIERVATIVRDLTSYARDSEPASGPVDLAEVIEGALKLVEHDLRHRAKLARRYEDTPMVDGNAGRLQQVFVNLLVNASQALRGTGNDDQITVQTGVATDGAVFAAVVDNGAGIPLAVRERVFDPFFTTKPAGEGTGLGLPVSKSIVEAMGGRIEIDSTEGAGTTVTVTLKPHRWAGSGVGIPLPGGAPSQGGPRRRVLVIDDEPLIRRVVHMVIEPFHDVIDVDGGEAALAVLATHRFDAVVCDLMMPGMSGMDLYDAIRTSQPGLERRIVFVTGGAFVHRLATFLDSIDNPRVAKPFDESELLTAIGAAAER